MISSDSNVQIKELTKLQKQGKQRKKTKQFVVEGTKMVVESWKHSKLEKIYVAEQKLGEIQNEFSEILNQVPYEVVLDSVFKGISETVTPQGILGLVKMPSYELEDILQDEKKAFLLLDNLRDPGNLGTIMRTAEGAGMSGIILSQESVDLFNPKVVRSTMGAIFRQPFYYTKDLLSVIEQIRSQGIMVYGSAMEGSVVYDKADFRTGAAFVIGNEANGISKPIFDAVDGRIHIPMGGQLESLNAAVAAAIVMYEIARQRRN